LTATVDQNAAKMFGGVDSLIEETQDWFFKDQNQLAMGFENWGASDAQQDWGALDWSFFAGDGTATSSSHVDTTGNSPAYRGMPYAYDPGTNGNLGNGYGQFPPTNYTAADMAGLTDLTDMNGMNNGTNLNMGMGMAMGTVPGTGTGTGIGTETRHGNGMKRTMPSQHLGFDDELYY